MLYLTCYDVTRTISLLNIFIDLYYPTLVKNSFVQASWYSSEYMARRSVAPFRHYSRTRLSRGPM